MQTAEWTDMRNQWCQVNSVIYLAVRARAFQALHLFTWERVRECVWGGRGGGVGTVAASVLYVACLCMHSLTHTRAHTHTHTHVLMLHSKIQVHFVVLNFIAFTYIHYNSYARHNLAHTCPHQHWMCQGNVPKKKKRQTSFTWLDLG